MTADRGRRRRPCLDCGRLSASTRCAGCARVVEARRTAVKRRRRPRAGPGEDARRAAVVAAWKAEHGPVCPGWHRPPHPATDLTADHVVPVGAGGAEGGPLQVLCRACNGRKAARVGG